MILLSFDIEEFDMPLEYNGEISFEEQIDVSRMGLERILDLLKKHNAKATFFSTVVFAEQCQDLVNRLLREGHELASLTELVGLRMPRMSPVGEKEVFDAGYIYNSSINPTFLPGRYNNLGISRKYFYQKGVLQIPASVSLLKIPLFWLSFHNFPMWIYQVLAKNALRKDGYLNIYFHPWEFAEIKNPKYQLPNFTTKNTGEKMVARFDEFLAWLKKDGNTFGTFKDFLEGIKN